MKILATEVDVDRKLLAKRLAKPLADLMTKEGDEMSASELQKIIQDPNTTIEFPDILVTQAATSRVRVRVRRRVRVRSIATPQMETELIEED
jgi:hypothetical protein